LVYGLDRDKPAIELIDIDRGRVAWRDTTTCAGPGVGVTADVGVCTDVRGTRAIGLDGKLRWHEDEHAFVALTGERVVMAALPGQDDPAASAAAALVLDAASGDELARVKLPANVTPDAVLASCGDAGHELFAAGQGGKLARVAEGKGGAGAAW